VFTPNEDGVNDNWEIEGIDKYPNHFIEIFSQKGKKVFDSSLRSYWTGFVDSHKLPKGKYVYNIKLDEDSSLNGEVTLIV